MSDVIVGHVNLHCMKLHYINLRRHFYKSNVKAPCYVGPYHAWCKKFCDQ